MVVAFLAEQDLAAHPLLRFGRVTEGRTARHNVVKVLHVLGRDGLVVVSILTKSKGKRKHSIIKIKARLTVRFPKLCQLYTSLAFAYITK